jgi:DNA mismatch repair ATPase MutL
MANEQQETLYHKRQRIELENLRTNAYKHTLIQTKRREWSRFRRNEIYRSPLQPVRLSTNIRRSFQVNKENQEQSLSTISHPIIINALPPRIYPPTFNLRQVTSKQSMNINILHQSCFLGQFDRKFLISKRLIHSSNETNQIQLILFDQHAISERILLEHLQTHFQKENIRTIPFQLPEPAVISRNPRFLYTPEQISILEQTGFIFSSISTHNLLVRSVPSWLLSLRQRQSSTSLLDDIIHDTINNILLKTTNSSNNIELIIYETLKSLACHNAIKFNDILSSNECHHLLSELKTCSMPFICAHGRTSAAILWEYDITPEKYQVDMIELKQRASIHKWLKES